MTNGFRKKLRPLLKKVDALLSSWGLSERDWLVVDAPALIIAGFNVNVENFWRTHLNVYLNERKLPWHVMTKEEAIPPPNSAQFRDFLSFPSRWKTALHLVPASKYLSAISSWHSYPLSSGLSVRIADIKATFKIWLIRYKELVEEFNEGERERERIANDRINKLLDLKQAAEVKNDRLVVNLTQVLIEGYLAFKCCDLKTPQSIIDKMESLVMHF